MRVQNSTRFFALYLSLVLATLALIMHSSSASLIDLVIAQTHKPWLWFFVQEPIACLIFLTAFSSFTTNKQPSTNSYLMIGWSQLKAIILSSIFVAFFLGGGLIPFVSTQTLQNQASHCLFYSLLALSILLVVLGGLSFIKLKKDPVGNTSHTKILIEGGTLLILGLIIFLATSISGKMILSDEATQLVVTIFQGAVFLIKILMICGFFAWIHSTLPRMKDKHLTRLGWIVLVPLALGNVVVTGVRLCLLP